MTLKQLAPWIAGFGLWILFAALTAPQPGYLVTNERLTVWKHGRYQPVTVCRYEIWHGGTFTIPVAAFGGDPCPVVLR